MHVFKGILLKIASALIFAVLSVMAIYAWQGKLSTAVRTNRPIGHVTRGAIGVAGMFLSFAALARLPLAEVTAIGFAAPLITVALAALILHERVRIYRWSAVAVGFVGMMVMLAPHLDAGRLLSGSSTQ